MLGGYLYDTIGYEQTMNYAMVMNVVLTILYLFFDCGFNVFKQDKEEKEQLAKMKEINDQIKAKMQGNTD
mgnify:CR=1 FL=1